MAKEVTILPIVDSFIYLLLQTHSLLPTHLPTPQPQSRSDDLTRRMLEGLLVLFLVLQLICQLSDASQLLSAGLNFLL